MLRFTSPAQPNAGPTLTIVPTATMAEHARHQQARSGIAIRPRSIQTLAQLLDGCTALQTAPAPLIAALLHKITRDLRLSELAAATGFPGFQTSAVALLEEAPAAGLRGDWGRVTKELDRELSSFGMARRNVRLANASPPPLHARVSFEGFFTLSAAEVDFVASIASHATVTLPEWPSAEPARKALLSAGFREETIAEQPPGNPRQSLFAAPSIEREAEEIASLVLQRHAQGHKFREMGIILRTREPYAPLLQTTLARFGIPARFYFADPLAAHPAIAFLSSVVEGTPESLLQAIRMPVSGIGGTPEGDRLDFAMREKLPAAETLPAQFSALDPLRSERRKAAEWPARLKSIASLVPLSPITDGVTHEQTLLWRSTAAALRAFEEALTAAAIIAASLRGTTSLTLPEFWPHVETVLAHEPLRVPDARRDVVHVMDVFEARQWTLPVMFVCGLTERHFPQYHREDPLLGDAERNRLGLETAATRQHLERHLFDFAITRATQEVILSYPRFNEKGDETLPSFFLDPSIEPTASSGPFHRLPSEPRQSWRGVKQTPPSLKLSPSSIQAFLQCPFQFFASRTLRLRPRPAAPRDRLDFLLQGTILHRAIAEWSRTPLLAAAVLDRVFEEECASHNVPPTYRTEAVRLELLRNFEIFLQDGALPLGGWTSLIEEKFQFQLSPQLTIRGRIDRLEQAPGGQALVIDYKYSGAQKIREQVEESGDGDRVQAGLYLAAAERAFKLTPAGMLFCGLKKEVKWGGWHLPLPGLERIGTACTPEALQDLIHSATESATRAHAAIVAGEIAPRPADPAKCAWCDYRDICRVESASQ